MITRKEVNGVILTGLILGYMVISAPIELLKSVGILPRDGMDRDDNR